MPRRETMCSGEPSSLAFSRFALKSQSRNQHLTAGQLLSDPSGEGWVKHMLHGTSMILRLSRQDKNMSSLRRTFYGIFRMLEASRALLYGEATILSEDSWVNFHKELVSGDEIWDPIEEILALMIRCSTFNLRCVSTTHSLPNFS